MLIQYVDTNPFTIGLVTNVHAENWRPASSPTCVVLGEFFMWKLRTSLFNSEFRLMLIPGRESLLAFV